MAQSKQNSKLPDSNNFNKPEDLLADMIKDPSVLDCVIQDNPKIDSSLPILHDRLQEVMVNNEEEGINDLTKDLICELTKMRPDDVRKLLCQPEYVAMKRELDSEFGSEAKLIDSRKMILLVNFILAKDVTERQAILEVVDRMPKIEGYKYYHLDHLDEAFHSIDVVSRHDSRNRWELESQSDDYDEYALKILKGEPFSFDSNYTRESYEEFDLRYKDILIHNSDVSYALPSYAIWRMFKRGDLANMGIDDKKFLKLFTVNNSGKYFNFAKINSSVLELSRLSERIDGFDKAVREEIDKIVLELLPAINAVMSKNGTSSSAIARYSNKVFYDVKAGCVATSNPEYQEMNAINRRVVRHNQKVTENQKVEEERKDKLNERLNGKENRWNRKKELSLDNLLALRDLAEQLPKDVSFVGFVQQIVVELGKLYKKFTNDFGVEYNIKETNKYVTEGRWDHFQDLKVKIEEARQLTGWRRLTKEKNERTLSVAKESLNEYVEDIVEQLHSLLKIDKKVLADMLEASESRKDFIESCLQETMEERDYLLQTARKLLHLYDDGIAEVEKLKSQGGKVKENQMSKMHIANTIRATFEE